jgi:F0F1-type ATP synthase epsilon subunit
MKHQEEDSQELTITARSPFHIYYEGPATSVTATNKVGVFDILPGHADFFSMLTPDTDVVIENGSADPVSFSITNGMITARDDEVMLFVNM